MSTFGLTLALLTSIGALLAWYRWRRARQEQRRRYIRGYRFPPGLEHKLAARYPHLRSADLTQVFTGLRQFFLLSLDAPRHLVAMPSQAVDQLWHEFILHTRHYEQFCHQAFGRFLHHTPAVEMGGSRQRAALRCAWRLACRLENLPPAQPGRLPLLFGIDATLGIADGYHYALDCAAQPRASGTRDAPWCAAALMPTTGSGGVNGDSDNGSSDGCSDGGSSCGGGCGGGGGD